MTLEADLNALKEAAAGVAGIAGELDLARAHAASGEGKGDEFGWHAQRAGIPEQHNTFITAMVEALADGQKRLDRIADIVLEIAADLGATDKAVADEFHTKETPHV